MINLDNFFEKIRNENILLAVSGGVDSMVMLDLFIKSREKYGIDIEIAHFNHMTREGSSDFDAEFVEKIAEKNNIKFHYKKYSMEKFAKDNNISEEEAGRILRHNFFKEIVSIKEKKYLIATAHNKDDQAETIMMRIIRGTGIDGLQAMGQFDGGIIRPLLFISKKEIYKYAKENNLKFVQDMTNFENIYLRNKIRNELIPFIEEKYNPNFSDNLVNLAKMAKLQNDYIKENILKKYDSDILIRKKNLTKFRKDRLKNSSEFELIEIFRIEMDRILSNYNFTENHYREILKIYYSDKKALSKINGFVFYNSFRDFIIRKDLINNLEKEIFCENDFNDIINGYEIKIKNKFGDKFIIRKRKNGDRILINNSIKKLKDFFIDKAIDAYERDFIPIVEYENNIIAIGDMYINNISKSDILIKRSIDE